MDKKIFTLICLLAFCYFNTAFAQKTGIGTRNPVASSTMHIDGAKNNATAPAATKNNDDVVVMADGKLGIGTITPVTRVDLRSNDQKGIIGLGTNTGQTAVQAGAGAIRYSNILPGVLEYSDGEKWIPLPQVPPIKALVLANNKTLQIIADNNTSQYVTGWLAVKNDPDVDPGGFTPGIPNFNLLNGTFTAPRDAFYIVSFNITLATANIPNNSRFETIIESNTSTNNIQAFKSVNSYPGFNTPVPNNIVSGNCNAIFNLKAGNTIRFRVYHTLGGNRNTSIANLGVDNSISIYEL
ncbi:hypothetical protein [Pedobacter punctiformis]|uniref:C1q domain-containing protein n=1 Tax=Pedobacter punctiformis TaxID=3004097 RepID=A0ABT4LDG4_9SPHI|nr:hypothetical protein [Pedobacter sp. HCMS5-2]MCZ4245929.1 hypothetical protein [Pedobacter sp. HCMS5-2]